VHTPSNERPGANSRRPQKGDFVSLEITGFGDGPDGLALVDGYVVFVPHVIPGERVRVELTSAGRKHGRGVPVALERASPDRVEPGCLHFEQCGGCQLRHVSAARQRDVKRGWVTKALAFALGVSPETLPVAPCVGPPTSDGQRTKIALALAPPMGRAPMRAGLFARRSNDVVALSECPAQTPAGTYLALEMARAVRELGYLVYDARTGAPGLRSVVVRDAPGTGQRLAIYVGTEPVEWLPKPLVRAALAAGATAVAYSEHPEPGPMLLGRDTRVVEGPARLVEEVGGVRYALSPAAFFQTSAWGARHLVEQVRARIKPSPQDDLLDLYCGVGLLGLALARQHRRVYGVEESAAAIEDARAGAALNGLSNTAFKAGRAEDLVTRLPAEARIRTVVVDPPREGCDPRVLAAVARRIAPERLVYVSCEPRSLARDAATLRDLGWGLVEAAPFDMFPNAAHVETLAVFEPHRPQTTPRRR